MLRPAAGPAWQGAWWSARVWIGRCGRNAHAWPVCGTDGFADRPGLGTIRLVESCR